MSALRRITYAPCLALALLLPVLITPAQAAAPRHGTSVWSAPGDTQSPQFEALPLERSRQNHLLVRAFINGKPALLGVDSGAPVSAIAITRLEHFGVTRAVGDAEIPRRLQINGTYNNVVMAKTLRLGALSLVDEPLVAIDLGGPSRAARMMKEQAIDGIIGADILFPTSAVLDCREQILTLKMDPKARGNAPGTSFRGFTKVPMFLSPGSNLYVDGHVNGVAAKLMVDTGAFSTLLHEPFAQHMKIKLRGTPFTSAGVNLKSRDVQLATLTQLSIGSVQMRRREVHVINLEGLVHADMLATNPPVAGLLGSEILQRNSGIIDFGTKTLYLKRD